MREVCIIGAGAAGLCALRHVNNCPGLHGTVFEQLDDIGGIWTYTDQVGEDVHSAAYKGLRTNLPKEIMGYSWDFPFPETERSHKKGKKHRDEQKPSYVNHKEVKRYLEIYAEHYNLEDDIQLNMKVVSVKPVKVDGQLNGNENKETSNSAHNDTKWEVTVQDLDEGTESVHTFDSVIVCNGHYSKPFIPDTANLTEFQGTVMHSKDYRSRKPFKGKKVVVVGSGSSGMDILLAVSQVASEVVVSLRNPPIPYSPQLPPNIVQKPRISKVKPNGVLFENEEEEYDCDIIVFCTGYKYDFPFLDHSCEVTLEHDGKVISPLYNHMIHVKYPTLCFVGLPYLVIAFFLFDVQMQYYARYLTGQMKFPTEMEMRRKVCEDKEERRMKGLLDEKYHQLGELQWSYYETLSREGGFPHDLKEVVKKIGIASYERRVLYPMEYKEDVFCIVDPTTYIHIKACLLLDVN